MNFWLTSDLHFGHVNIIRYCDRPFSNVVEMNMALVARWNAQVDPGDVVWVLGDLCMGHLDDSLRFVSMLNGQIRLVPGNHDPVWSGCSPERRLKWRDRYESLAVIEHELNTVSIDWPNDRGWMPARLCHFPRHPAGEYDTRFSEHHPVLHDDEWLLHGHVHDHWRQRGRDINVGIDAWGGRLVSPSEIAELIAAGPNKLESIPWPR